MKHRKIFRRYKAGYEVWLETNAVDFSAQLMGDGSDKADALAEAINDAPAQVITMKIARTPEGRYIGDPKTAHYLCKKRGIAPELADPNDNVCSIGFCEREQKWYGWSHRAIYGFGVGSHIKQGDCGYVPKDKEDFRLACIRWWKDDHHDQVIAYEITGGLGELGIRTQWTYSDNVPNENLRSAEGGDFVPYPDEFGRGEWIAATMDDARQMACDFAEGVG